LNLGEIKSIPIPVPPLPEQKRIVVEVERRLSILRDTEKIVDENLNRVRRLRQSILKVAFEGRLVPQDPTDEPAEKLLKRIRAERTKSREEKDAKKRRKNKLKQLELSTYVK
jgi:type I restriction enzyme S subunit